jgi:hypothetical protein
MRGLAVLLVALCALLRAPAADAFCRCHQKKARAPRCADPQAKHKLTVAIELTVVDGTAEVVTQSGPYHVPVADLDGKTVLFLVTPRNVVFQGFTGDVLAFGVGTMHGAQASITTGAVFAPGEYEVALFVDVVPGGASVGPQRGDLAAFDNTPCDPTGVSVRAIVGCDDATLTLVNRHFIIF